MLDLKKMDEVVRQTVDRVIRDYPERDKILIDLEMIAHEALIQCAKNQKGQVK